MKLTLEDIYSAYKKKINGKVRLTAQSKAKIITRLKEFSFEDLLEAIDSFSKDTWRMENNASKGMVWFFDTEDKVARWLALDGNLKVSDKPKPVLQKDNTESDWVDAQLARKKWLLQTPKEKSKWWFKYSFATHWGLRDGGGTDYEGVKERMGREKMKEVYIFILNWYQNNPKLHSPAKHEYEYLLPKGAEKIEGWTKVGS